MTRSTRPPSLLRAPGAGVDRLFVVMALGGETAELEAWEVEPGDPRARWSSSKFRPRPGIACARTSRGGGLCSGSRSSDPSIGLCSSEIRCVIRHHPIPRIAGSGLRYPDQGLLPVVDLGSTTGDRPSLTEETGDPFGDRSRHVGNGNGRAPA